jgi:hypothetical protein
MLKSSPVFIINGAHLVKNVMFVKNRIVHIGGFNVLNMQIVFILLSNFAIIKKYSKTFYDNLNYYVSLVILQTYKNVV